MNTRTKIALGGAAAVLVAGTAGAGVATAMHKDVTLSVDGRSSAASVFGSTVGDLLADEGISLENGDVVLPSANTALSDGDTVTVKYARDLTLTVDGKTQTIRTTETSLDAALAALGSRYDGGTLSASRSQAIGRDGLAVSIITPKAVTLTHDGRTETKTVAALTVKDALTAFGVSVDSDDRVTPAATTALGAKSAITVNRVQMPQTTRTEPVAFTTTRKDSADLYVGTTKTQTAGVAGVRTIVESKVIVDGKATATNVVSDTVTKAPVNAVVLVGTKARPAAAPKVATTTTSSRSTTSGTTTSSGSGTTTTTTTSSGGLNLARAAMWDRVAACESTGNWHINTGNGYYGGLQFSASTWLAYGGGQFAPRADLASREQQITVANRAYADNGLSQWGCKG